jgi:hypothetical protein
VLGAKRLLNVDADISVGMSVLTEPVLVIAAPEALGPVKLKKRPAPTARA